MKIYTKTGDAGETGLWGGERVSKDAVRVQAYGSVDETNAALGVVRTNSLDADLDQLLGHIQDQLFVVGADLATPRAATNVPRIGADEIATLETAIDELERELEPLRQFIQPGGTLAAAHLHLARTICRRAERWVVALSHTEALDSHVGIYLNRLSDLLFVLARVANKRANVADIPWNSPRQKTER